jgi:1-acyl-sn-glycerol-3-phosphate acyltransferase
MTDTFLPNARALEAKRDTASAVIGIAAQLAAELNPGRGSPRLSQTSSLEADAGLDSLGRMELLRRLESRLAVQLAEEDVFAAETIGDLLAVLGHAQAPFAAPETPRPRAAPTGEWRVPEHAQTLLEVLQWHAERHPEQAHIHLLEDGGDTVRTVRYADLWQDASNVAAVLRHQALEPGEAVALMLPTGTAFFAAFAGIWLAGGVPVPIYPPMRMAQIEEHLKRQAGILDNARAVLLITVPEARSAGRFLQGRLPRLRHVLTTDHIQAAAAGHVRMERRADDVALLQYTSGSTGNPKGVVLCHANLLANVRAMGRALQVDASDVFVSWLPLYHDMGLIGAWMGTLYFGIPLVLMSPLAFIARPHRWLWAIHRFHGTLSAGPNFAYELCAHKITDAEIEGLDLGSLRFTCNGAEPVSAATIDTFTRRFAPYGFRAEAMAPVYGLAECSVGLTFPPLGRTPRIDHIDGKALRGRSAAVPVPADHPHALRMVGCGLPLSGHEVRIVDDSGYETGERRLGRLQFRGPSATQGYFHNPEATAELLDRGWLNSGDYAYLTDGEVFIAGRAKDLIIRAGRNIYPYDLEQAIGHLDGVRAGAVAVFGSRDPARDIERLVVLAESRLREPGKRAALRRKIEQVTSDLVQVPPDDVVLAPPRSVLKTSSGKIRRSACRESYERGEVGRRRPVWSQFLRLTRAAAAPLARRAVSSAGAWLYAGYAWAVFGIMVLPVWLLVLLLPGIRAPHAVVRAGVRVLAAATFTGLHTDGSTHLPGADPCVVVANHASYLDALVLGAMLPHGFQFVAKRELARSWFLAQFLRKGGTRFVERFNRQQGAQDTATIVSAVREGRSLVFFPEGTFGRAPGLLGFRMGAFVAAAQSGLPVVPVAILGTRSILRGDQWFPRHGRIEVRILAPITVRGNDWQAALELRDRSRAAILAATGEPDLVE